MITDGDLVGAFKGDVPVRFKPSAYYDPDGDCVEFFASNEDFKAERLDRWVTVYFGAESGEVVGSMIKDIRVLFREHPGLNIEIEEDGKVCLSHLLRATAWKAGDPVVQRTYKVLISKAAKLWTMMRAA